jgi:hypothetical protein
MSRLFHTLVVFGAGAALSGCGGQTRDSTNIAGPNGGGAGGAGGETGAGGISSSGGRIAQGGNPATGGTVGTGGAMLPDPPTLAQWSCETLFQDCTSLNTAGGTTMGFLLNSPCPIDPKRPRTPADCTGWFECDLASFQGTSVAVDCHCVPVDPNGCNQPSGLSPCDALTSQPWYRLSRQTDSCVDPVKLCGCAYTGILR